MAMIGADLDSSELTTIKNALQRTADLNPSHYKLIRKLERLIPEIASEEKAFEEYIETESGWEPIDDHC
jgi:hypothetical protein